MPQTITDPLFILAVPRSYSSVASAMLGEHPNMYALPETHLFGDETVGEWWSRSSQVSYQMAHGLVRAVAEIIFGEQSDGNVLRARGWIRRRSASTSGLLFEELGIGVRPARLIDKSPSMVYSSASMERARRYFPEARYLHLVRHPSGYGESVVKYLGVLSRPGYRPRERLGVLKEGPTWLETLASFPYSPPNPPVRDEAEKVADPQSSWYVLNSNVVAFLHTVPKHQWMRVRGEDLLTNPSESLSDIVSWLGHEASREAVEAMMHPERSPYARFGPAGARLGNDILFLEDPQLRLSAGFSHTLTGPVSWLPDGQGLLPEVQELARSFGYGS